MQSRGVVAGCGLFLIVFLAAVSSAQELETRTVFEFSRSFDTCDSDDLDLEGTTRVVYSWNDNLPDSPTSPLYHGGENRGTTSLNLVAPNPPFDVPEDDLMLVNMRLTPHTIPANGAHGSTLYWCEIFEIPSDQTFHVVQFDIQANPDNVANVHHASLRDCPGCEGYEGPRAGECPNSGGSFSEAVDNYEFNSFLFAWAVGGSNVTLPPDVGLPVGANEIKYVMLEMHYDLPNHESITDDSGIVLHVTPSLRPIDAGILLVGSITEGIRVPPGQAEYKQHGWCVGQCLDDDIQATEDQKINMFAGFLHSHLAGREMAARHFRNGTELEPIVTNRAYDFDYQQYHVHWFFDKKCEVLPGDDLLLECTNGTELERIVADRAYDFDYQQYHWFFDKPREVLPGDDLLMECTYNTEGRTEDTVGGLRTTDEMCIATLFYYPRINTNVCFISEIYGQVVDSCGGVPALPEITTPFVPEEDCSLPPVGASTPSMLFEPSSSGDIGDALGLWRSSFDNSVILHGDGAYKLYWTANATSEVIRFGVDVATDGWLGFGFSPNGGMVGSDVIMAWIDDDAGIHFSDRKADARQAPRIDASQDYFDIRGSKYTIEV